MAEGGAGADATGVTMGGKSTKPAGGGGTIVTAGRASSSAGEGDGLGGTEPASGGAADGAAGYGSGGAPSGDVPTAYVVDNVRLVRKAAATGGAGPDSAGAPGSGGEPISPPDFVEAFNSGLDGLAPMLEGFSPGPGGSGGPPILDMTELLFNASAGHPGGALIAVVPFSVPTQQATIFRELDAASDLTGYELLAEVKLVTTGKLGDCPTAWLFAFGESGYANDATAEPASGETNHLALNQWRTIRLDLDGPYGYHTNPGFQPTDVTMWGLQFNTWGCE